MIAKIILSLGLIGTGLAISSSAKDQYGEANQLQLLGGMFVASAGVAVFAPELHEMSKL